MIHRRGKIIRAEISGLTIVSCVKEIKNIHVSPILKKDGL